MLGASVPIFSESPASFAAFAVTRSAAEPVANAFDAIVQCLFGYKFELIRVRFCRFNPGTSEQLGFVPCRAGAQ